MEDVTMTHPQLPGQEITVSEKASSVYEKNGWVRKGEDSPQSATSEQSGSQKRKGE